MGVPTPFGGQDFGPGIITAPTGFIEHWKQQVVFSSAISMVLE